LKPYVLIYATLRNLEILNISSKKVSLKTEYVNNKKLYIQTTSHEEWENTG